MPVILRQEGFGTSIGFCLYWGDVFVHSQFFFLFTVIVITTLVRYLASSTFIKMLPIDCLFY